MRRAVKIKKQKEKKEGGIERDLHDLHDSLKQKFNELKNLYRENKCCLEFIRVQNLSEKYSTFRDEFYRNRKWR